ncbi:MAG: Gfo/Idh/MocA family oxidoreductase [Phycisphaerae bacterium]|nr:Gfo/Idh/MocA family oxidoreductase [Phycisphaerae bacterium]
MGKLTRRRFFRATASAAFLPPAIAGTPASTGIIGANGDVRVAVVGMGRGQTHIQMALRTDGFRLAALCDVDPARIAARVKQLETEGHKVSSTLEFQELLEDESIDAITIATPNHWHSLMGILACRAGKDVYVEKPISHNVWEGRQLVSATRRYGRIVQTGTQARANPDVIEAVAWIRAGNLGKIKYVRGLCYKPRPPIGKGGGGKIPPGLDYDRWCGPGPLQRPLRRKNLHYDWHWIYDYGNGDLGNQGIHEMDMARWFLGYDAISPRVISIGGRLGYDDDGQTPNTQLVYHDYDGPPLIFEVRGLPKSKAHQDGRWGQSMDQPFGFNGGRSIGVIVACEGGTLVLEEGGQKVIAYDRDRKVIRSFHEQHGQFGIGWHKGDCCAFLNWLKAVRSRKPTDLAAEILEGHVSTSLCHTGMISHRLGQRTSDGEILERIRGNSLAEERFESMKEHLERNGVNVSDPIVTLGPWLAADPKRERFLDNDAANAMLTRDYRKPYALPEVG